jgi:hypothetical protein
VPRWPVECPAEIYEFFFIILGRGGVSLGRRGIAPKIPVNADVTNRDSVTSRRDREIAPAAPGQVALST